ncbi:Gti1/Pac2 family-domain-containing protein [Trametes gibbosa]|nr:Gti1/Pac2 family-domain-containing protein [Trametes gibbosa]
MQLPTCTGIRIRTMADAHVIFHAVTIGLLPIVSRRLDIEERRYIHSGCVCVWEERSVSGQGSSATGIERWTDGRRWGPSRVRDEFLYYQEKLPEFEADEELAALIYESRLIKQTYSVFVDTPTGRRKWHLVAYFTGETLERLSTVDDIPELAAIRPMIPSGKYNAARLARQRTRPEASDPCPLAIPPDGKAAGPPPEAGPSALPRQPLHTLARGNLVVAPHPRSDICLPSLKPTPWGRPRTLEEELAARKVVLPCARADLRRRHEISLAPLVYLRKQPYPPRDVADDDVLQKFDCGVV